MGRPSTPRGGSMNPAQDEQSADQHGDRDPELNVAKHQAYPAARARYAWIVAHGGQYCTRSARGRNNAYARAPRAFFNAEGAESTEKLQPQTAFKKHLQFATASSAS